MIRLPVTAATRAPAEVGGSRIRQMAKGERRLGACARCGGQQHPRSKGRRALRQLPATRSPRNTWPMTTKMTRRRHQAVNHSNRRRKARQECRHTSHRDGQGPQRFSHIGRGRGWLPFQLGGHRRIGWQRSAAGGPDQAGPTHGGSQRPNTGDRRNRGSARRPAPGPVAHDEASPRGSTERPSSLRCNTYTRFCWFWSYRRQQWQAIQYRLATLRDRDRGLLTASCRGCLP